MGGHSSALSQPIKELREVERFMGTVGITLVKQELMVKMLSLLQSQVIQYMQNAPFVLNYFMFKIISIMHI